MTDPFAYTRGNKNGSILVVGEAWGNEEARAQAPFIGAAGKMLEGLLRDSGIPLSSVLYTNVVDAQPPGNEFHHFLYPNSAKEREMQGVYPRPALVDGVEKLGQLISLFRPKLIITCGNWPLWALTDKCNTKTVKGYKLPSGVGNWRGSQLFFQPTAESGLAPVPLLPIIHPAAILREYSWRSPTLHDLKARACRFLEGKLDWAAPEISGRHSEPVFSDAARLLNTWRVQTEPFELSVDIETWRRKHISCIGFSDGNVDLCVPFFSFDELGNMVDYWTLDQEAELIWLIYQMMANPNIRVIGQNYIYDYQWVSRLWGIRTSVTWDTMLMHHVMWPGTPKSLDYLSSLYCNHHVYWKEESEDWDGKGGMSGARRLWNYNCEDVRRTFEIAQILKQQLNSLPVELPASSFMELYHHRLSMWRIAAKMSTRGVKFDKKLRDQYRLRLLEIAAELEQYLLDCMPEDLAFAPSGKAWYHSPKHTADIFYTYLKIAPVKHKKTGNVTVNTESLATIRKRAPYLRELVDVLSQYRSLGVYVNNFLDVNVNYDGLLRCNFNVAGTDTFRWSSSANGFEEGMNLQNLSKGKKGDNDDGSEVDLEADGIYPLGEPA